MVITHPAQPGRMFVYITWSNFYELRMRLSKIQSRLAGMECSNMGNCHPPIGEILVRRAGSVIIWTHFFLCNFERKV